MLIATIDTWISKETQEALRGRPRGLGLLREVKGPLLFVRDSGLMPRSRFKPTGDNLFQEIIIQQKHSGSGYSNSRGCQWEVIKASNYNKRTLDVPSS